MSVDVAKVNYGAVVGPSNSEIRVSKVNFGAIMGPSNDEPRVAKVTFGIVIGPQTVFPDPPNSSGVMIHSF